jgi:hypothetical protein
LEGTVVEVYVAVIGPVVASIVTYLIARGNQSHRRDVFYEKKITDFMTIQEKKINELQKEVARLTAVNLELLEKIIHLEGELSR